MRSALRPDPEAVAADASCTPPPRPDNHTAAKSLAISSISMISHATPRARLPSSEGIVSETC